MNLGGKSETECCSMMGNSLALCSGGYEIWLGNVAVTFTDIFFLGLHVYSKIMLQ